MLHATAISFEMMQTARLNLILPAKELSIDMPQAGFIDTKKERQNPGLW